MIESWATQLLRLRDGKTRGLRANGILVALGKEMIRAAKEEGGYPDSDDSDDEDEDRQSKAIVSKSHSRGMEITRDSDGSRTPSMASTVKSVKKPPIVFRRHKMDVFTK